MNVIIYCRVSSDEQAEGTSLDVQEQRLLRYCEQKGYNVIDIPHREDASAKTFEKRPVIQNITKYIKSHKEQVQKLLFLRWDRYSRDLTTAMIHIQELRKCGIEPNAIECEVDYKTEMWPLMIGLQIGMAQGDNIKRSKATLDGIHGTLLQGKCSNKAPRGYKNVCISKHDKRVEIDKEKAPLIKAIFEEVAKGVETPLCIKRRMCPKMDDASFYRMLHNIFYVGKIRVPSYNDEAEQIVQGVHEPLVSEYTFNKVQDILSANNRKIPKLSKSINPDLYLRKFLVCPICGRSITGATSKGHGGKYNYYHCQDRKHIHKRAEVVNDSFADYLSQLKPRKEVLELYKEVLEDIHGEGKRKNKQEVEKLKEEMIKQKLKLAKVEDMLLDDKIDIDSYNSMKKRIGSEIDNLKQQIDILTNPENAHIGKKLQYSIDLISNIGKFIKDAPVRVKIKVLGSMFPQKIEFDGKNYRTCEYNNVLELIYLQTNELRGKGNKKSEEVSASSHSVPRPRIELGTKL